MITYKEKINNLESFLNNKQPKSSWFVSFSSVLVMVVITELIINVAITPSFDTNFSVYPFEYWFILRIINLV